MTDLLLRAGLGLVLAWIAGSGLRLLGRRSAGHAMPVLKAEPGLDRAIGFEAVRHTQFQRSDDQGNFGEILTAMMMTAEGWWSINGKVAGPRGIDGIFLRRVEAGWQACLIETKTNSGRYLPRQMSNAKLLKDLDRLYLTAPARLTPVYAALSRGLQSNNPAVGKQLWRHSLSSGQTQAFTLDAEGVAADTAPMPSQPAMMRALFEGLDMFDRQDVSIQLPDS